MRSTRGVSGEGRQSRAAWGVSATLWCVSIGRHKSIKRDTYQFTFYGGKKEVRERGEGGGKKGTEEKEGKKSNVNRLIMNLLKSRHATS